MSIKIRPINHSNNCNCEECNNNSIFKKVVVPDGMKTVIGVPLNSIDVNKLSNEDRMILNSYLNSMEEDNKNSISAKENNKEIINASMNIPKPAIRYDGFNVYTPNNVVNIPANIYNVFAQLGVNISDLILQDANSDTLTFDMNTLGMIVSTNMCICIDNFMLTLDNVYSVCVNKMTDKFNDTFSKEIINNMTAEEEMKNKSYIKYFRFNSNFHFIGRENLAKGIIMYINSDSHIRKEMYNNIMSFTMAYINNAGLSIYNDFRNAITILAEDEIVSRNTNIVERMFKFIEEEFSALMINFCYEAGIFTNNIIDSFDILYNPAEYLKKILGTNSITNFDFKYPSN